MRIVIVEDQKELCHGLARRIESLDPGCRVVGKAYDGLEGEKIVRLLQPDIVFLDIAMPFQNGLDTLRKLKQEAGCSALFVLLTGFSDFAYVQQALRADAFDYLLKPASPNELKALLAKCGQFVVKRLSVATSADKPVSPGVDTRRVSPDAAEESGRFVEAYIEQWIASKRVVQPLLLDSLRRIARGYRQPLELQQVAAELHVSESYLSRLFSRELGINFIKLLHKVRIELSKHLISRTQLTISEIAQASGFDNVTYFGRVFKDLNGVSASEYRSGRNK